MDLFLHTRALRGVRLLLLLLLDEQPVVNKVVLLTCGLATIVIAVNLLRARSALGRRRGILNNANLVFQMITRLQLNWLLLLVILDRLLLSLCSPEHIIVHIL